MNSVCSSPFLKELGSSHFDSVCVVAFWNWLIILSMTKPSYEKCVRIDILIYLNSQLFNALIMIIIISCQVASDFSNFFIVISVPVRLYVTKLIQRLKKKKKKNGSTDFVKMSEKNDFFNDLANLQHKLMILAQEPPPS